VHQNDARAPQDSRKQRRIKFVPGSLGPICGPNDLPAWTLSGSIDCGLLGAAGVCVVKRSCSRQSLKQILHRSSKLLISSVDFHAWCLRDANIRHRAVVFHVGPIVKIPPAER